MDEQAKQKRQAARWSLLSNSALLTLKLIVSVLTGSVAVLAEVIHSGADLVGSIVAFASVRVADEPPDSIHAYGHGKIENLSGVATALSIAVGGLYTIWEAVTHLREGATVTRIGWALATMALSFAINLVVSRHLLLVGRATDSPALISDGYHLQTDVWTSLGVFVGLSLVAVTHAPWWDSAAALIVAVLILRVGWDLARDALRTLADSALPPDEEKRIADVLLAHSGVLGYHKLRTRKSGSHRHVDVHVQIDDSHSFVEAHRLTEELEDQLRDALPNLHPIIHMEPFDDEAEHQRQRHGQG